MSESVLEKLAEIEGKIDALIVKVDDLTTIANSDKFEYKTCPFCGGDGVIQKVLDGVPTDVPCTKCKGTGQFLTGTIKEEQIT